MARVPFRALGRPYSGRHGITRAPAPVAEPTPAQVAAAPIEAPVEAPVEEASGEPVEASVEPSVEAPIEEPAEPAEPSAEPAEPSAEASAEEPAEPSVEASAEEPDEEPDYEQMEQSIAALFLDEPPAAPAAPAWEPTWTKAQLLAVTQAKGLTVTSANTKAEIIAALTAAG